MPASCRFLFSLEDGVLSMTNAAGHSALSVCRPSGQQWSSVGTTGNPRGRKEEKLGRQSTVGVGGCVAGGLQCTPLKEPSSPTLRKAEGCVEKATPHSAMLGPAMPV